MEHDNFADYNFSPATHKGLKFAKYETPTDIQRQSIGIALEGNDLLAAAKTGSGKTLAFIIPLLECLYKNNLCQLDGLGALVISPTRELAYQTFKVLRKVGRFHDFSAGLVIGGKFLKEESERINRTNIVICTPGRLLQHFDETLNFNADNLKMLIIDEADRILDLGFKETVDAIVAGLPTTRQTLLFSATQTKSVNDLVRLSLNDPVFVSVHENAPQQTPDRLQQTYMVCELCDKLTLLWSFVKTHLHSKILTFLATCKQVRFVYQVFCKLRPGLSIIALHGNMKQPQRMAAYEEFCRKQHVLLLATDIAARGLDFPGVNWIIQLDCPEDAKTYIHRAGRSARYAQSGNSLLVLSPSEEPVMLRRLEVHGGIPISKIEVNPKKQWSIEGKLSAFCASDPELKTSAQRAFTSYLRAIFLMSDKELFDVQKLDFEKFSRSLGLAVSPRVRFLNRHMKQLQNRKKNTSLVDESPSVAASLALKKSETSDNKLSDNKVDLLHSKSAADDGDSLFTIGAQLLTNKAIAASNELDFEDEGFHSLPTIETSAAIGNKRKVRTKFSEAKRVLKKGIQVNSKITFDTEGEAVIDPIKPSNVLDFPDETDHGGLDIELAKERLRQSDIQDKKTFKERIKQKHKELRLKRKKQRIEAQQKRFERNSKDVYDNEGYHSNDVQLIPFGERILDADKADSISKDEFRRRKTHRKNTKHGDVTAPFERKPKVPRKENRISNKLSDNEPCISEQEELALRLISG